MPDIRILHLSDLHYSYRERPDQQHIAEAVLQDIKSQHAATPIGAVVFSGDLVNAGSQQDVFAKAYDLFISPILDALQTTNIAIVPGNHDIDRECIENKMHLRQLEKGFSEDVTDSDQLNQFIDATLDDPSANSIYFEKLKNYHSFENNRCGGNRSISNYFLSVSEWTLNDV